ncbi:uncharacterized protein THITE_2129357 [Thermothielavioides terrestris NRRL 8126]|uniref:Uncharacterized protein n=1 Tax=Thermothielavioides terrestris (strain ATCC 38088 / NRRL 8126) TaxID=578455 RepID=G2R5G9_THETT|nr:uncharacterized protein THITE_2129357 [Thermothielavioides terrestris NRRL 8126]AEO67460.1 hypothetical protein THITE_2129357 [Thermothielavioides terrestris NRRL 8126]
MCWHSGCCETEGTNEWPRLLPLALSSHTTAETRAPQAGQNKASIHTKCIEHSPLFGPHPQPQGRHGPRQNLSKPFVIRLVENRQPCHQQPREKQFKTLPAGIVPLPAPRLNFPGSQANNTAFIASASRRRDKQQVPDAHIKILELDLTSVASVKNYEPVGVDGRASAMAQDDELASRLREWTARELEGHCC